jgi:eukaryotic-like serine/threonine-protein kinase
MPNPKDQLTLEVSSEIDANRTQSLDGATVQLGASSAPVRVGSYAGQTIDGRYAVDQVLGEGGMGVVYAGRHQVIGKRVAIKILRGDMAADQEMTERFLNEARAASSIGNPHIVDISDFGRLPDGATYFVMEYLDGKSLAGLLADLRTLPVPRLVHIAKQIARGLSAAHDKGITHRDLKPDNVMLIRRSEDSDFVKVLDFGIAKVGSEAGRLTRAGSVFGTPHYMSPEQAAGVPVDHRADIYSLGVMLYEMASGRVPFDADNFMGILTQHMYKAPAPIRAVVPQAQEIPPGLEAVVLKCLSKKVELRYQTMAELVSDLEKVESGVVPDAVPEMMSRSGGFNVPADYFRTANAARVGGAALLPASPASGRRRAMFWWPIAGAVVTSLIVIVGVVSYSRSDAETIPYLPGPVSASDLPVEEVSDDVAEPVGPTRAEVVIAPVPEDSAVFEGDRKLGIGERAVYASREETVSVRVERTGFKGKTIVVDGSEPRVRVRLERDAAVKVVPPVKAVPKPSPSPAKPPPKPEATTQPPQACPPPLWRDPFGNCTKI